MKGTGTCEPNEQGEEGNQEGNMAEDEKNDEDTEEEMSDYEEETDESNVVNILLYTCDTKLSDHNGFYF